MLPSSHSAPIEAPAGSVPGSESDLAQAFSVFVGAANRLERSYEELQREIVQLRCELELRNAALASSIAENERMRVALHLIVEALPCGVVVLQARREIFLLNPEGRRLLGLRASGVPGWEDLPARVRAVIEPELASPSSSGSEHEFCIQEGGNKRWLAVRLARVPLPRAGANQGPQPPSGLTVLICRDTTAQHEVERTREASRNMLALTETSAVLAHEIRNPLASLELFAGLLAGDSQMGSESRQWVSHVQAGIRSLAVIVNNVLHLKTRVAPQLSRIKVSEILRGAADFVRPLANQAEVRLVVEDRSGGVELAADPNSLQQVLLNLAGNAFRHSFAGGQVTLSASTESMQGAPWVVIQVADEGEGIPAERIPQIFEAGYSTRQGPGLGLAVCRHVVEQHRGSIAVASQPQQGAIFRLEFPVA